MVNTIEIQWTAPGGWVIEVMSNRRHPVTNWMVVGPYYDSGSATDSQGVAESMDLHRFRSGQAKRRRF